MIKVNGEVVQVNHFPDGTQLLKQHIGEPVIEIDWRYENDEELFTVYCLKKQLEQLADSIYLNLYYIPNARQDRVKNQEDVFTLKRFAEMINFMKFDLVHVLDPHSSVSTALIDNVFVSTPESFIEQAYKDCKPDLVFYPDDGAMKRYSSSTECEYVFGIKKRDWKTGKIEGLDVVGDLDKIKDSKILIVDDICSRGGTFYYSAKKLKELGAREIYLYITHCENTIFEGELLTSGLIEKVYTTDSLFNKQHEKIEVFKL